MRATLSIRGLTKHNPEIWDHFVIPTGLNKQDIIDSICLEFADLELLFPDAEVMKDAIGLWSRRELPIWEKLYATTNFEYNPIWNVDEHTEEKRNISDENESENQLTGSNNSTGTSSTTTTHKSNSFDSGTMVDNSQDLSNGTSGTQSTDTEKTNASSTHSREDKFIRDRHGNIGVTSTQSLIKEEREVADFDIEEIIIDSFKARFCLLVY